MSSEQETRAAADDRGGRQGGDKAGGALYARAVVQVLRDKVIT